MQKNVSNVMIVTIVVLVLAIAVPPPLFGDIEVEKEPVQVFILAGQSNMEGKAANTLLDHQATDPKTKDFFAHLRDGDKWVVRDDVFIKFLGRKGPLTIGYGSPGRTGSELEFGHMMGEHFDEPVILIKAAWGGHSLFQLFRSPSAGLPSDEKLQTELEQAQNRVKQDNEKNNRNNPLPTMEDIKKPYGSSYRNMMAEVKGVFDNYETLFPELKGRKLKVAGFAWFQGFNDQWGDAPGEYESNMRHFIKDVRKDLKAPTLPFVIAAIGTNGSKPAQGGGLAVRTAQMAMNDVPEFKGNVKAFRTDLLVDKEAERLIDGWQNHYEEWAKVGSDRPYHYLGSAIWYTRIGHAMGEAMMELKKKNRSRKTRQDNTLPNGLPILHSNPGAPVSIFIDFQFESVDGKARTFSLDKDLMTFNKQEQEHIRLAWAKTASSFAPFDVDVTTIEPHPNHPYIWQTVLNQPGSGGSSSTTGYVPLSGQKTAKNGSQRTDGYRWCGRCAQGSVLTAVITHESGHAHGVSGHETYDEDGNRLGIQTAGIERGPFTRSVGPIGRWYNWQSEWGHPDRNPAGIYWVVDDIKVITSQIIKGARTYTNPNYSADGFRTDEHGNDIASATKMTRKQTSKSWISSGTIERITDKDVFSFRWPGGTVWIGVRTAVPTPLLDAKFVLYDSKGAVVGIADPAESMQAALQVENLAAGTYYVEVSSDGDYSELGKYEVTVSTLMPDSLNLLSHLELNGNFLADSSEQGNKVAWHGSAQWVKGRDGSSAAGFDGSNRIIISASGRNFTPNGLSPLGRTFAFWFKADDVTRTAQQVLCRDARSGYKLYIEDGKLKAHAIHDAGLSNWRGGITLTADVSLKSRQWYHAALAHRTTFSEVDDTIALYLNGKEAARGPAGPVPSTSRFEVGGSNFTGAIDDVWFFGEMIPGHLIAQVARRSELSQHKPTGTAVKTTATVSHNMVKLSWKAVNGATSYEILRSVNNQQFEVAGEVSSGAATFMDTGLQASRRYFYSVRAVGTNGVGTVDVTTRSGPVSKLRFARYTKSEEADLQWSNPVWGHNCEGKYGIVLNWFEPDGHRDRAIRIERSTDGVNFRPLITLPSTESVYCDHNLACDTEYIYRVVTIDSSGDASSAVISVSAQ